MKITNFIVSLGAVFAAQLAEDFRKYDKYFMPARATYYGPWRGKKHNPRSLGKSRMSRKGRR